MVKNVMIYLPVLYCKTSECPLTQILSGESRVNRDVEKECVYGKKIPCAMNTTPFWGPNGELIGIVENFRDIAIRKNNEEALRNQQKELQERLAYEKAVNFIAETIVSNNCTNDIFAIMSQIIGKTLKVDRTMIFHVDIEQQQVNRLCGWINPDIPDIAAMSDSFNLNLFSNSHKFFLEHRELLQSHIDNVNSLFVADKYNFVS